MSVYDPTHPPLFLTGTISSINSGQTYPYTDETGLNAAGAKIDYTITVGSIDPQSVGDASVRTGGSKQYTALDIKTGDWIASANGQICLQIISVDSKTDNAITFTAKDVDMISYKTYATNSMSNGDTVVFFEVSDNGQPLITTADITAFQNPGSIDKIQGRFAATEETERYRFEFSVAQTSYDKGDTITVDTTDGSFVKFGATNASDIPLGIVLEKTMGDRVIYIKPFNTIIDNYSNPELLTGNAGNVYYTDPANPGQMTTTNASGSKAILLQVKDAIATVVTTTVAGYLPDANDSLIINGVESFEGGVDTTPATVSDLVNLINTDTATHFVTASKSSIYASTETGDGTGPTNGVVIVTITDDGGSTFDPLTVTIGDGTTSSTITFDENTGETLVELTALGAPGYFAFTATEIANVLNADFTANGINLEASTVDSGTAGFPNLKISATSASATINISGTDTDKLGDTFLTGTGVAATTSAASSDFLVLTRADGGDILITASKGDYINVNGLTSSSMGSPAVLLMIEGAGAGTAETGVETSDDLDWIPNNTSADGDYAGITITYTPYNNSNVQVTVNGVGANLGDGVLTKDCYFSDDNGVTAKTIANIEAEDKLYWNGSIAGYELETTDLIDIIYDASSNDL